LGSYLVVCTGDGLWCNKNKTKLQSFIDILRSHVELAIFLTLALGFLLGRIRIGSFKLGVMLGTLFAGVLIGQLNIPIPMVARVIFFDLFLFATGYKVGPQFFYGLKKDALPQLALTIVICVSCLIAVYVASRMMGYDVGTAAGLLAGSFTESTVIGTAGDAIQRLSLPDEEKTRLVNNIPIAYAVTYLVGTSAVVWFLTTLAPKILRVDLKKEAEKISGTNNLGDALFSTNSAYEDWLIRAYKITNDRWSSVTVEVFEQMFPGARILVERIRKNGSILDPKPGTIIEKNDVVAIAARQGPMLEKINDIGIELHDKELLDFPLMTTDVIISRNEIVGSTLSELAEWHGQGIMLKSLKRGGQELPFDPSMIIKKGDKLQIFGRETDVKRVASVFGFREKSTIDSDIIAIALGIVIGGFVGALSVKIGGVAITLSISGGALLLGLIVGWLHSRVPSLGAMPEAALWIFDTMGLATFLGIVGIAAGPTFISGLKETGFGIIPIALLTSIIPHIIGIFFGRYVLRMNPLILLGAHSGAGTNTTALKAVQEASGSKIPVLGYTIPYALGNIILTAWGPVIVSLMTR